MKRLGNPPYACLITEGRTDPQNFSSEKPKILSIIREAVSDGVPLIQVREKAIPARLVFDLVSEAVAIATRTETLILVNNRTDIALAAGADGVHLPGNSIPADVIRKLVPENFVIGVSAHTLEESVSASTSGADYVFLGPVFATPGKDRLTGVEGLRSVCDELGNFPVIGLGGVDKNNYRRVIEAGAAGVAAIRAMNDAADRREILHGLG